MTSVETSALRGLDEAEAEARLKAEGPNLLPSARKRSLVEIGPSDVRLGGYYVIAAAKRWNDRDITTLREWLLDLSQAMAPPLVASDAAE